MRPVKPGKCVKDMTLEEQLARLYQQRNDLYMVIEMLYCARDEAGMGPREYDKNKLKAICTLLDIDMDTLTGIVLGPDDRHPTHDCAAVKYAKDVADDIVGNMYTDEGHNFVTGDDDVDPDVPGNEWSYARFKWDYKPPKRKPPKRQ